MQVSPILREEFLQLWKSPYLFKVVGKKLMFPSFQQIKKLFFIEKIFNFSPVDLTPNEDFYDELEEETKKKFGLLLKNSISEADYFICFKFYGKKMVIQGKIDELSQPKDRVFLEFVISTFNLVFSSLGSDYF